MMHIAQEIGQLQLKAVVDKCMPILHVFGSNSQSTYLLVLMLVLWLSEEVIRKQSKRVCVVMLFGLFLPVCDSILYQL